MIDGLDASDVGKIFKDGQFPVRMPTWKADLNKSSKPTMKARKLGLSLTFLPINKSFFEP